MLKLLKNMRRKEVLMVLLCTVLVAVQVYFDLRLPDYMTDLTTLIKRRGRRRISCPSARKCLAARSQAPCWPWAAGISRPRRRRLQLHGARKALPPRDGHRQRGDAGLFCRQPHHENDERHHANSDDRGDGPADDDQIADHAVWAIIKILARAGSSPP